MTKRGAAFWDEDRTVRLDQEELHVEKKRSTENAFYVWNRETNLKRCPRCGGKSVKMHDLFSKRYLDLASKGSEKKVVSLEYQFHKYRCLNEECRHIFTNRIRFAARDDHVTHRLEDEVARSVIRGESYGQISEKLNNQISKQAVGQIFNRWVRRRNEYRRALNPPSKIAILSGVTKNGEYTLFLNLDDGIRVYEILYGVSSAEIGAVIRKIGPQNIKVVLSDCHPTITAVIQDNLPEAVYIIPVEYWFDLVTEDFKRFAHEQLKWSGVRDHDALIMKPQGSETLRKADVDKMLESRPELKQPYEDYNHLRRCLVGQDELWIYDELAEWAETVDEKFKEELEITLMQLDLYKIQIQAHVQHREEVPETLHRMTKALEAKLSDKRSRNFSTEALQARVLYKGKTNLQNWSGVPIGEAIDN